MPVDVGWVLRVLKGLLPSSVRSPILGDLEELYPLRRKRSGPVRARLWLLIQCTVGVVRYAPRRLAELRRAAPSGFSVAALGAVLRQLRRAPAFALLLVVLVGVGIGANVAVYSLVDGILLSPMPYPQPERIVSVSEDNPDIDIAAGWTSMPNFTDWQEASTEFEAMAMFRARSVSVGTAAEPEYAVGALVSREFFEVFGVEPTLGRSFTGEEVRGDGARVVILSEGLWTRGFGADPEILGKSVPVDGTNHVVVGVMPEGFNAPGEWLGSGVDVALWRPLSLDADPQRENRSYNGVARIADSGTLASARRDLTTIHDRLRETYPEANESWSAQVLPWSDLVVGPARSGLLLLMGVMLLVLAIVCANVAALAVDRVLARGRELSTRLALGASRLRLMSLVGTELGGLVVFGGLLGIAGGRVALTVLRAHEPGWIPRLDAVSIDLSVVLFGILLTGAVAVLVGLMAVFLTLRSDVMRSLRTARGGVSPVAGRLRSGLTLSQFAASFALLAGALLLGKSYRRMARTDLGFDGEGVIAMTVALSWDRVQTLEERTRFTRELLAELEASQAVESAAMINSLPLSGSRQISRVSIDGLTEPGREPALAIRGVSANYHEFLRIPLVEGRFFEAADISHPEVALVNRRAARLIWEGTSPVGARLERFGREYTVVGVTGNVLHDGPGRSVLPELYIPYSMEELTSKSFLVRGTGDDATLGTVLRQALRSVDPAQPAREIRSMAAWAAARTAPTRFLAGLMAVAAAVATLLAGVGLFGAMAGVVRERRREIALRMAVGADPTSVMRLMGRKVALLVGPGLVVGTVFALLLEDAMTGLLFGVDEGSAWILAAVAAALTAVSVVAAMVPAVRARAVQPMQLLREE